VALAAALLLAPPARAAEDLVPGAVQARTDALGVSWAPDLAGRIRVPWCWALSGTQYSEAPLSVAQQQVRRDGSEFVLDGQAGAFAVQRRLRVDTREGGMRVVEVIKNPTAQELPLALTFWSHFDSGLGSVTTDQGRPVGSELGERDTGLVASVSSPTPSALLLWLSLPGSAARPQIAQHNNQVLQVTYTMRVPAGGKVAVALGLRAVAALSAGGGARRHFRTYEGEAWLSDLPLEVRRLIVNRGAGLENAPEALPSLEALIGVAPGTSDQLAFAAETLVPGTASCRRIVVHCEHGEAEIPFEEVAAVVGALHPSRTPCVFLHDGQRLVGRIECEGLRFEISTGLGVELDVDRIDRLVMRSQTREGAGPGGWLVETLDGTRLLGRPQGDSFGVSTRWGTLPLRLEDLVSLRSADDEAYGFWVWLEDGTRFRGLLAGDALRISSRLFGDLSLPPWRIAAIVRSESHDAQDVGKRQPRVALAGGEVFVGTLDLDVLHFAQPGQAIPQTPAAIRILRNLLDGQAPEPGESLRFEADLWNQGRIVGELTELVLPVRTSYGRLDFPVRDIVEVYSPTQHLSGVEETRIRDLVRKLDDPDWETREAATRALEELGEMARPSLEEALRAPTSPEAERRLRRIVEGN